MRCRACDVMLEGGGELCGTCAAHSYYATLVAEKEPEGETDPFDFFRQFIYDHGLVDSWLDGLGLLAPVERFQRLYDAAYVRFEENLSLGMPMRLAAAKATGVSLRGNQRFARQGVTAVQARGVKADTGFGWIDPQPLEKL